MRFSITALLSTAVLGLASAYTQPVGDHPSGNPISQPGLGAIVPVGTPYTITWNPTTAGTVTLVLLRGPSTNVVPLYPIAEKIANTGVYVWTPSAALQPDTTHYGIQLIVDATGQFQYTTQFGISNPAYGASSSSSYSLASSSSCSSSSMHSASAYAAASSPYATTMRPSTTTMAAISQLPDGQPQAPAPAGPATAAHIASASVAANSANATSAHPASAVGVAPLASTGTAPHVAVAPTGAPAANATVVQPTGSMSVPATLLSSTVPAGATGASTSAPAKQTAASAAGRVVLGAGGALAGVGAVFALLL